MCVETNVHLADVRVVLLVVRQHSSVLQSSSIHQMAPKGTWPENRRTHLQPTDDLLQRQDALGTSDEGGRGQPEDLVQVRLIQTVEACKSHVHHSRNREYSRDRHRDRGRRDKKGEGCDKRFKKDVGKYEQMRT